MLELKNLTKKYGDNTVLNYINFTFENGICGLLGAVFRKKVGYTPQLQGMYEDVYLYYAEGRK